MGKKSFYKKYKAKKKAYYSKRAAKAVTQLVKMEKGNSPYTVINNPPQRVYRIERTLLGQSAGLIPTTTSFSLASGPLYSQPAGSGLNGNFNTCVAFQADEVPSFVDFASLFQQYRIDKIEFTVRMINGVANSQVMPTLYIWKNYQPSLLNTDISLAVSDQAYKVIRYQFSSVNRECKFAIVPYYLEYTPTGNTPTSVPASIRKKGWLDCSYGNVNHYGVAYSFDNLVGSSVDILDFEFDYVYHMSFKGVK